MRPRTVILTSIALSVVASAITTMLLAPDRERAPRATSAARTGVSLPDVTRAPPPPADIEERFRRIEARLDTQPGAVPARSPQEVLDALLAITQGEQQIAIEQAVADLSGMGNDVVSAIVALLKSGRDQDYGGGFGMSGNKVRGYPRLRTALIDVLRQIATPEAKAGLLDALQGSQDPDDYRDIFLLYAATSDEQMVRGVSSMIPMALGLAAGDDPSHVALFANEWINRHGIGETAGILEQIARERLAAQAYDSGTFGTLVRFAPERAFDVARDIHRDGGEKGLMRAVNSLTIAQHEVPLAQLARYYEMMLSLDLSADFRWRLYSCMPATPCRSIKDAEARDVDTAAFLQFLRKRLPYETDPRAKEGLARKIELLEKKAGG